MEPFCKRRIPAYYPRALGVLVTGLLLGTCSGGPTPPDPPDSETPAAPAVSAGTRGQTSVTVSWTPPATDLTIIGYELQWRTDADADWTTVTGISGTETSYTITGLQPRTTYEVQVRALFATTAGAWSESITVSTTAPPRPPPSDGPGISEPTTGSNSITVTWTAPDTGETITGYELNWRSGTDTDWTVVTGISSTETSYTISGLQPQTAYEVRVRALFATTVGAWSESITVSTTAPPRPPPSDRPRLSLTAVDGRSISVAWVAPATGRSITGYELRVRGGSLSQWKTTTGIPITTTAGTIEGLQPHTTYEVQVRAMFGEVAGSWSAILTANTGAYTGLPIVGFLCDLCHYGEFPESSDRGIHFFPSAVYSTAENLPVIRYRVSETGDMLASTGVFEAVRPDSARESSPFSSYPAHMAFDNDDVDEPDSMVTITIVADTGYLIGRAPSLRFTITDDDDPPSVAVDDVTVTEGDGGTVNATFTVSLSTASGWTVTVDWATSDGTATAGADYTAGSGTLTFAAGDTSKTVDVAVTGDTVDEDDETFTVTLSNADHASIPDATALGTITDND